MATTVYALMQKVSGAELDSQDEMTLPATVIFWRNVNGTVQKEVADVYVSFDAGALLSGINDAFTDEIVAFALSEYGWALPRTHVIFFGFQRGLIL